MTFTFVITLCAALPTQEEAEKEIEIAEKAAKEAAVKAAKLSAAAGMPYDLPAGVGADVSISPRPGKSTKTVETLQKEALKVETEMKMIEAEKNALEASTAEKERQLKDTIDAAQKKLSEIQSKRKRGTWHSDVLG